MMIRTHRLASTLLVLGFCVQSLAPGSARAAEEPEVVAAPAVDAILEAVQLRYADAASVHARFLQTSTNLALAETTEASGECWFAKPGKMRWIYEAPEAQSLVSDGSTLWFHQPTRFQVLVSEVPPELSARIPTAFFSGTGDLAEDYDAQAVLPETGSTTGHVIDLVPKADGEAVPFRKLRITVDTDRDLVTRIEIHDLFGNVNRLDFTEIELLETVDEKLFNFEIPEDTRVVRPPT